MSHQEIPYHHTKNWSIYFPSKVSVAQHYDTFLLGNTTTYLLELQSENPKWYVVNNI